MEIEDWSKLVGKQIDKFTFEQKLAEGNYGVTFKAVDQNIGTPRAIKILKGVSTDEEWMEEPRKAARIRNCPYIALPLDILSKDIDLEGENYKVRGIVWEYVDDNAMTLKEFLGRGPNITAELLLELCRMLCIAIKAMMDAKLQHGDLHPGNIMVIPPPEYDTRARYVIKIVDFGLAASLRERPSSDIESLGKILHELWDRSGEYEGELILGDKRFLQRMPALITRIMDRNPERKLADPVEILQLIEKMREEPLSNAQDTKQLSDPFEYKSAEEMPEESDLVSDLYTDSLPWFKTILSTGTMLISGIRGCGKSMVLRNMRLKTKLVSEKKRKEIRDDPFLGFYLHSNHSLNIPFGGKNIKTSELDSDLMLHYFNLLYTHEIVDSLRLCERVMGKKFTEVGKRNIFDYVTQYFEEPPIVFDSTDIFDALKTALERESKLTEAFMVKKRQVKSFTGVDYLLEFCRILRENISLFQNKKVYFLLDDFSDARGITPNIQKSINRVIGIRNDRFCFKITTERFAFIAEDSNGNRLDQGREYEYCDLSQQFIVHKVKKEEEDFFRTLVSKRFSRAGIHGDITTFLGKYTPPYGNFGRSLAKAEGNKEGTSIKRTFVDAQYLTDFLENYKPPSVRNEESEASKAKSSEVQEDKTYFAGFKIAVALCTGDISTLLELCRAIWVEAGGRSMLTEHAGEHVPFDLQNRMITQYSRQMFTFLKGMPEVGDQLYTIACAIGEVFHDLLVRYPPIIDKHSGQQRYHEVIRIMVDEKNKKLSPEAEKRYRNLIKFGVFTDLKSKYLWKGELEEIKLVFRKIYAPCFRISYRDRLGLRLSVSELETLLLDPENFAKQKLLMIEEGPQTRLDEVEDNEKAPDQ